MSGLNEKPWNKPWNDQPWKRESNDLESMILREKLKISEIRQRLCYNKNFNLQKKYNLSLSKFQIMQTKLDNMVICIR